MTSDVRDKPIDPWLSIIGIGEDGLDGLSAKARRALDDAKWVWGGKRHLSLANIDLDRACPWPSPLDQAYREIVACRGIKTAVLASGDPFHYGIGSLIAQHVSPQEITTFPMAGAFSLAAARMGWAVQATKCLTVHGRPLATIRPHLTDGARLLLLSWDETTPQAIAQDLCAFGYGGSQMTVLEALGGEREKVRTATCSESKFDPADVDPLNTIAIHCKAGPMARPLPLVAGLSDDLFAHDGQITKRPIRAITLSSLAPHPGELLWDIGLGSGSIAIEWLLRHPENRAIGIERHAERAERARDNATRLGVPQLHIVTGHAPEALAGLDPPHAVFIGGGGSSPGMIDHAMSHLSPGGRLVMNAVTLETEALLLKYHAEHGGDLMRIDVAEAEPVGPYRGWRPSMPLTHWRWVKP